MTVRLHSISIHNTMGKALLSRRDIHLATMNVEVEASNDRIRVIDSNRPHIGKRLDLGGDLLALLIRQIEAQLAYTCLDRVPAGQSRCEVHVSGQSKIVRVEDLVRGWIVELNILLTK
jgi:hypothetical protein